MSNQVRDVLDVLEQMAPAQLAEKWDNVGLQAGSGKQEVSSVMIALDVTMAVLEEAAAAGCSLLISHHPLIFVPLKSVSDETAAGSLVLEAGRLGLSIAAAHTNLDAAKGGLADMAAEIIGLAQTTPLTGAETAWHKLVAFVPQNDLAAVRKALFNAGAGIIGDYRHCSYFSQGTGTFLPVEGAEPSVGEIGAEEEVEEIRLEMVFPVSAMESITAALVAAHSYEEPAYDIYPLATRSHAAGAGRMGSLALHPRLDDFAASVAASFGMEKARYSGNPESLINKAAVVTGSGAGYIREASGRAEVLVTGDFRYHDLIMAQESGLALVEVPHDVCELEALKRWAPQFGRRLASMGIKIRLASTVAGRWRSAMAASASGNEEEGPGGTLKKGENSMYDLHVDGGARGNPGPAGIGVVLSDSAGSTVASISEYIGEATNNVAEYRALIEGLKLALERGARDLRIYSDSELVVRQLGGSYKVKNEGLRPYYEQAKELLGDFTKYELISIPREKNNHADDLVNHALDEAGH